MQSVTVLGEVLMKRVSTIVILSDSRLSTDPYVQAVFSFSDCG